MGRGALWRYECHVEKRRGRSGESNAEEEKLGTPLSHVAETKVGRMATCMRVSLRTFVSFSTKENVNSSITKSEFSVCLWGHGLYRLTAQFSIVELQARIRHYMASWSRHFFFACFQHLLLSMYKFDLLNCLFDYEVIETCAIPRESKPLITKERQVIANEFPSWYIAFKRQYDAPTGGFHQPLAPPF